MGFNYSCCNIYGREKALQRTFEILPGFLSWLIIIGITMLCIFKPFIAAVIMIAFILYWVLRLLYMNIFLILSYMRLSIERETNWMERINGIDQIGVYLKALCSQNIHRGLKAGISSIMHCRQLKLLHKSQTLAPESKNIYHLVIIPVIKETRDIIEPGIRRIKQGSYPSGRILVIVALEESAESKIREAVFEIQRIYKNEFMDFLVALHPNNIPGEARVKGANVSYAAGQAKKYFDEKKIPYENVIVSCFDADTVPRTDYFSCLTYYFMVTPERLRSSYQPIPVYHNNIWDVPAFARIIDIGTSFFQLIEATNARKLVTFSSHSMSFKALVDVNFWPVDMISDDSAIFWKSFIHYNGNYQTVPIYTTVSMDIAGGNGIRQTFANIYKQKRRWAWGVENVPIVMRAFLKCKAMPVLKKLVYGYKLWDTFISWATWSFLLGFLSWLPGLFVQREFSTSTVYYIAPRIRGTIFSLASVGIIICIFISLLMLPAKKSKITFYKKIQHALEWIFIPVIILILSAIPALDAQTRLMFGRYMEFWVTPKTA